MTTTTIEDAKQSPLEPAAPKWLKLVPMLTGVLAGMGGYLTIRSTNLSNDAIYLSSQATLEQAKASDNWSEMQANSIKARLVESLRDIAPANADYIAKLNAESTDFRAKEPGLRDAATTAEKKRDVDLQWGLSRLKEKDLLGYAGMAVQLGIALASVAALVKNKPAFYGAIFCGAVGAITIGGALLTHYFR